MASPAKSLVEPAVQEVATEDERLEQRVGKPHFRLRTGIEREYEGRVFGYGRNFFHIENWYSVHGIIRGSLALLGLHKRGRRNARAIQLREHEINLGHLPAEFDGFTILQISDLHLDMHADIPGAIAAAVSDLEYDLCVLTGDFRARTYGPYDAAIAGMRELRAHLGSSVYGILGNHDSINMVGALEGMDVRMLMNESVALRRGDATIYLAGIDDPHYYRADNLEKALQHVPDDGVSILLSHSPEMYLHAAYACLDVMLCGHTHGGQICLPGGIPLIVNANCPRRLCNGRWRYNNLTGYTSAGAGACVVDVRFNCPPEVTLHRLRRTDSSG